MVYYIFMNVYLLLQGEDYSAQAQIKVVNHTYLAIYVEVKNTHQKPTSMIYLRIYIHYYNKKVFQNNLK